MYDFFEAFTPVKNIHFLERVPQEATGAEVNLL
jgi:hypothetical protein